MLSAQILDPAVVMINMRWEYQDSGTDAVLGELTVELAKASHSYSLDLKVLSVCIYSRHWGFSISILIPLLHLSTHYQFWL